MDDNKNEPSKSDIKKMKKLLDSVENLETPKLRRTPKQKTAKEKAALGMAIAHTLSEYTDCYVLLGFDTNGNSMILINSANNLETRALSELIQELLDMQMFQGRNNTDFTDE